MAIDQVKARELADQIAQLQTNLAQQLPAEILLGFEGAIQALVNGDIAANAVKVGQKAPEFSLPDQLGDTVTLSSVLQRGPAAVVFYRGEWCPYCDLTLRAYQRILPQIQALGVSLIAISPQRPDNTLTTVEKKELTFSVLSDVGNVVGRTYGLVFVTSEAARHPGISAANGDESWQLPIPGTFVIAQDGTIILAFVDADWTHRLEPAELLKALAGIARGNQ
jgi:peroxiredoxin